MYGLVNSFQGTHTRATLTYFNSWDRLRIFFFARSVGVINIDVLILFIRRHRVAPPGIIFLTLILRQPLPPYASCSHARSSSPFSPQHLSCSLRQK